MDDLSGKLGEILSDPAAMAKIQSLAQSLGLDGGGQQGEPRAAPRESGGQKPASGDSGLLSGAVVDVIDLRRANDAVRERIAAMKNNGVIRGFTTIIDAKAYNKMAAVFLEVEVEPAKIDKVALKLLENQDIAIVAQNTGTVGLHVHAYIESVDKLSSFLDECIYSIDGVKSVNSSLLIRQYKTTAWLARY